MNRISTATKDLSMAASTYVVEAEEFGEGEDDPCVPGEEGEGREDEAEEY
jgi:hypothetical protein